MLKIELCGGILPKCKDLGDAGTDLHASEDIVIPANGRGLIPIGIRAEFPVDWVALIKDRSSLALKGYYTHAGVIDSSYRGEWKVIVQNTSRTDWCIKRGDRVAQVLFLPILHVTPRLATLTETERGSGGFGSTGI